MRNAETKILHNKNKLIRTYFFVVVVALGLIHSDFTSANTAASAQITLNQLISLAQRDCQQQLITEPAQPIQTQAFNTRENKGMLTHSEYLELATLITPEGTNSEDDDYSSFVFAISENGYFLIKFTPVFNPENGDLSGYSLWKHPIDFKALKEGAPAKVWLRAAKQVVFPWQYKSKNRFKVTALNATPTLFYTIDATPLIKEALALATNSKQLKHPRFKTQLTLNEENTREFMNTLLLISRKNHQPKITALNFDPSLHD